MSRTMRESAERLSELWAAEHCTWRLEYDEAFHGEDAWWRVSLEWVSERGNPHHADWVTYTWEFVDHDATVALEDAVEWCEGLLPFERCPACDGDGEYGPRDARVTCEDCGGVGLASANTGGRL